jgi:anti-anti-sigma factor
MIALQRLEDGLAVLSLEGELDFASGSELGHELSRIATEFEPRLVVDLSGLTFIDSTGLNTLAAGARMFEEKARALVVACASEHVRHVFEIVHMGDTVCVTPTLDDAMRVARDGAATGRGDG